ncbi:MAG: hypothetical protein KBG20_06445 [Caldilineaceae bacterium]|nr:hypothetical protein [Caldilineaceae bacterium]MBP8105997.1 hypothetical protein [Caldilineaceae bacterium]MBP8123683.1 hypothetical protein [Caldilineaceae bacterium]MBP9071917.1 hypothetical protein [Caldilineaceae bacterium]
MRASGRSFRRSLLAVLLILALLVPATAVLADGHTTTGPNPKIVPVMAPRTSPQPIPHTSVLAPSQIYNLVVATNLPAQSSEAAAVAKADGLKNGNPFILPKITNIANGITLNYLNAPAPAVCNNFDKNGLWASRSDPKERQDLFTDWFGGWGAFAVNDGYRQAKNVVFSKENVVGPGSNYDDDGTTVGDTVDGRHSAKIASMQPYAAGFASPLFSAAPGAVVKVAVHYLIINHGNVSPTDRWDYDWASLGVKADAYGDSAQYVNGYTRGEWNWMENTVTVGDSGMFMVMIQGESPAALNSNIYFDDVSIYVDGVAMASCY